MAENEQTLAVRAIRTRQAGTDVFMFALEGSKLASIAEISRVRRDAAGELEGYQRGEIRNHVADIASYIDRGDVLFPNPIILALPPGSKFIASRGPNTDSADAMAGTLYLPCGEGSRRAWIVDGQQRSLALGRTSAVINIPVVAFVSADVAVHREQFILVNKAKPLPRGVVDVLLPTVDAALLPRDLGPRRTPNVLVDALNRHRDSPFCGLIKRAGEEAGGAVINDQALLKAIKRSIGAPLGALAPYSARTGQPDVGAMYAILSGFWSAARDVFPDAWGRKPAESRLMHAAGIEAMSFLMDRLLGRPEAAADPYRVSMEGLKRVAPYCRWTDGHWDHLGLAWNEVEYTSKIVRKLRDHLLWLEHAPRLAA